MKGKKPGFSMLGTVPDAGLPSWDARTGDFVKSLVPKSGPASNDFSLFIMFGRKLQWAQASAAHVWHTSCVCLAVLIKLTKLSIAAVAASSTSTQLPYSALCSCSLVLLIFKTVTTERPACPRCKKVCHLNGGEKLVAYSVGTVIRLVLENQPFFRLSQ